MMVECFARRIMAPFQGVLQVIRVGFGEAESTDGRTWILYAAHPDILAHSGLSEVRFGTWSRDAGLRRAAVRGTAEGGLVEGIGEPLIEALQAFAPQAPFPLRDRHECWLLDRHTGEPLVLMDSRLPEESTPLVENPQWLPGQAARAEFSGLAELERALAQRAGRRPQAAWFERGDDGSGVDPSGRSQAAGCFPRFLLTTRWTGPREQRLAEGFIEWWAPALLQLQHLDDRERARLERVAARRAAVLARLFRLYPKTLDEELIRVARVRARMQRSTQSAAHYQEPFLWLE
jgi:hypothetical protein